EPVGRPAAAVPGDGEAVLGGGPEAGIECVPTLPGTVTDHASSLRHEFRSIRHLFWHGRPAQGLAALERFAAGGADPAGVARLRTWLTYWYPSLLPTAPPAATGSAAPAALGPAAAAAADLRSHLGEGSRLLAALLTGAVQPAEAVPQAELVLRTGSLGGVPMESLTAALTVLLYADRADRAAHWCAAIAGRTGSRCGATWQALFAALRAETALRQGELRTAEEAARAAFGKVPPSAWGVAVGLPLATMAAVRTARGSHQDAAHYLARRTPEGMEHTPAALHHRYATGSHLLAVGRAEEALAEFRACGDAMARWGLDHLPAIAPWRIGAAQAQLALGRPHAAIALAEQQLVRLGPVGQLRLRGMALRVRAAAGAPGERTPLLEQAVGCLEEAGAEVELAAALAELSQAHASDGDPERARQTDRRARRTPALAVVPARQSVRDEAVREQALREGALPDSVPRDSVVRDSAERAGAQRVTESLSEAESRVAELAARGLSNREIARKLYITVSTVEQHLTRVYRKLGVRRRVDLGRLLGPAAGHGHGGGPGEELALVGRGTTGVA
ncbi:LuxR C-terminal-related transcriptional regulator, partial [Kitasatospora sp. MBT63]|uniref:LuxR C-terminal-related transcriptional regulator n=1 Tax=Kitasatospora sp. MBT63 TaxID=1444768 RepID=UPI001E2BBCCF